MIKVDELTKIALKDIPPILKNNTQQFLDEVCDVLRQNIEVKYSCKVKVTALFSTQLSTAKVFYTFKEGFENVPKEHFEDWEDKTAIVTYTFPVIFVKGETK